MAKLLFLQKLRTIAAQIVQKLKNNEPRPKLLQGLLKQKRVVRDLCPYKYWASMPFKWRVLHLQTMQWTYLHYLFTKTILTILSVSNHM